MVSLIERDHADVSFCSNHILGTALPPPSVGGLPQRGPVTCGFAVSNPAPSRRPCAVGTTGFPWTGASSRKGARPQPAASEDVQFVPVLTSFRSPRRHAPAGVRPGSLPPSRPRSRRLTLALPLLRSVSVRHETSGRALPPSSPSSPPMRCPGSGLQRSRRLSATKSLRPPWRIARDHGVSASGRRWRTCLRRRGIPAGVPSAETRPFLPVQRHSRGSNRVGEEGRVNEELSGSAAQERRACGPKSCSVPPEMPPDRVIDREYLAAARWSRRRIANSVRATEPRTDPPIVRGTGRPR
jgi:hypothetical protein